MHRQQVIDPYQPLVCNCVVFCFVWVRFWCSCYTWMPQQKKTFGFVWSTTNQSPLLEYPIIKMGDTNLGDHSLFPPNPGISQPLLHLGAPSRRWGRCEAAMKFSVHPMFNIYVYIYIYSLKKCELLATYIDVYIQLYTYMYAYQLS